MLVEVVLFITSAIFVAYLIISFVNVNKPSYQGKSAMYDLSKREQPVLSTSDFTWSESPCSIRFAIFVKNAPRTLSKVDCIPTSDNTIKFSPNCTDYSFKTCACSAAECSRCALDDTNSGYLSKLLQLGDNIQLWASGYTSQNDKPYVPALLKIRTGTSPSQHFIESISLPALPLQKWTIITIVKEGRRFDVYYGAKLQTSKLSDKIPISPDNSQQWMAGNSAWKGEIGLFMGFNKAQNAKDVLADVEKLVDTRGIPFYKEQMDFSVSLPSLSPCIFGNCGNTMPNVKPKNPFSTFYSSFS